MSKIQAILFDRNWWTVPQAERWLSEHKYAPIKELHETNHWIRARIHEPVGVMRIITLSAPERIKAVIMFNPSLEGSLMASRGAGLQKRPGMLRHRNGGSIQISRRADHGRIMARRRGGGWGYLDAHPNLLGDLATTALAGLAIAGIVTAVKKSKQ